MSRGRPTLFSRRDHSRFRRWASWLSRSASARGPRRLWRCAEIERAKVSWERHGATRTNVATSAEQAATLPATETLGRSETLGRNSYSSFNVKLTSTEAWYFSPFPRHFHSDS